MGGGRWAPPPRSWSPPAPPLWYCGGPVVFPTAAAVAAAVPPPPLWSCGLWFVLNLIDSY